MARMKCPLSHAVTLSQQFTVLFHWDCEKCNGSGIYLTEQSTRLCSECGGWGIQAVIEYESQDERRDRQRIEAKLRQKSQEESGRYLEDLGF